jgi:hypothetical protein
VLHQQRHAAVDDHHGVRVGGGDGLDELVLAAGHPEVGDVATFPFEERRQPDGDDGDIGAAGGGDGGLDRRGRGGVVGGAPAADHGGVAAEFAELDAHGVAAAGLKADGGGLGGEAVGAPEIDDELAVDPEAGTVVAAQGELVVVRDRRGEAAGPADGEQVLVEPRVGGAADELEVGAWLDWV